MQEHDEADVCAPAIDDECSGIPWHEAAQNANWCVPEMH